MGSKINPGQYDCYANALLDEPMFVLLARDPMAPDIVLMWASTRRAAIIAGNRPESDLAMCTEAEQCAKNMIAWRKINDGKWRK